MIEEDRSSLRSSLYSSRKKIFEQWPKAESRTKIIDHKSIKKDKNRQSTRAQELLQRSLNMVNNIEYFLQMKKKYKNQQVSFEGYLDNQTEQLEKYNSSQQQFNSFQYGKALFNYYKILRRNRQLLKSMECFSLANLANYNPQHTKMQFTRDFKQAQNDLHKWLQKIKRQRINLQQSLVIYEYEIKQSSILGQNQGFDFCFNQLYQSMKQDNIIKIHFLMIYQINDLEALIYRQKSVVKQAETMYAKHQALLDSIQLMETHTQQMKRDQVLLKRNFQGLNVENAPQIIPKGTQNQNTMEKNIKIYRSNKQNFVRYEAQTNMPIFRERRQKYTQQLDRYQKQFSIWRKAQQKGCFLYERQKKLKAFNQKATLGDKANFTTNEKESILEAYYQCLQCQVSKSFPRIKQYKYDLCGDMETSIGSNGIPLTRREQVFRNRKDDVLRRYIEFFAALQYRSKKQKISYLVDRKDLVSVLKYQLDQQELKQKNYETQKYRVALLYTEKIVECQQLLIMKRSLTHKVDLRKLSDDFDKIRQFRWRAMPQGFESVLFNYINDVRTHDIGQLQLQKLDSMMERFKQRLNTQLIDRDQRRVYTQANQSPYFCMDDIDHSQAQLFFRDICRRVSDISLEIKENLIRQFWLKPLLVIRQAYSKHFKSFQDSIFTAVEKRQFFTFKILCYMILSGKNLKVPNIEELCIYYMQHYQRGFYSWNSDRRYLQIVKLKLFAEYLQRILSKHQPTKIYVQMCNHLINFSTQMYECKLYLDNAKYSENNISYGLQIYKDISEFELKFSSTEKMKIQEKTKYTINSLKKLPIVIGTKRIYQSFIPLFVLNISIKEINQTIETKQRYQSQFLSRIYVSCEKLSQFSKATQIEYYLMKMQAQRKKTKLFIT